MTRVRAAYPVEQLPNGPATIPVSPVQMCENRSQQTGNWYLQQHPASLTLRGREKRDCHLSSQEPATRGLGFRAPGRAFTQQTSKRKEEGKGRGRGGERRNLRDRETAGAAGQRQRGVCG
jgi:hypothetical protein